MVGTPNIVFIECYDSTTVSFGKSTQVVRWAKIPEFAYELLTVKDEESGLNERAIVLRCDEEVFRDLYLTFGGGFREFSCNIKSLFVDQLTYREHKTLFVFGTKKALLPVCTAIKRRDILPLNYFTGSYYGRNSSAKGDRYATTFSDWGELFLAKLNPLPSKKALAQKPRP